MAKTLIRRAAEADFRSLLDIDAGCFPEGIAYDAFELYYFMKRKGAVTIVLEEDGVLAAFLILEAQKRTSTATMVTLDVREEFRRRGYATQLLEESEKILLHQGIQTYILQVDVQNAAAIAFYKKHGFQIARLLRAYYSNGHDAHLMVKRVQMSSAD